MKFKNQNNPQNNIINAVKEYEITKIAGILECGPKVIHKHGIEIFCYDDGILFFL